MTQALPPSLVQAFAPTGALRAAINVGNPVLAGRDPASGDAIGVSVDLSREFAKRLNVPCELVVFELPSHSVEAVGDERADVGFFAIDPKRGEKVAFTDAYVLIEGCYMVRDDSPLRSANEVDARGNRVAVIGGSAYDLFLTRELKAAQIVRAESAIAVIDTFLADKLEVAAGVKQQLEADAERIGGGVHLLEPRFMEIRQAMGLPKSRGDDAAHALRAFIEEMKANGFVAEALARHGKKGASVAPPAANA